MLTVILCFLLFFPLLFVFFLFDHHQPPHHPQALTNQVNLIDSSNLNGVWELDMSPDGKNVYAVTISSDAIVYWDRDTDTGVSAPLITYSLRTFFLFFYLLKNFNNSADVIAFLIILSALFVKSFFVPQALTNQVTVTDSTNLDNSRAVKVSHDGKNVYAVSWGSKTLVSFDRDMDTGVSRFSLGSRFEAPLHSFSRNSAYTFAFLLLFLLLTLLLFSCLFSYISLRQHHLSSTLISYRH